MRDAETKAEKELESRERGKHSTATPGRSSSRGKRHRKGHRKGRDQWDMEAMIESGEWPDGESAWQEGGEEEEAQECGTSFRRHLLQVGSILLLALCGSGWRGSMG